MVEGHDRRDVFLVPIDGEIALVRHQAGQDPSVDRPHIVRAVISPLFTLGQRRRDRKVEKLVIGRGDLSDRRQIGVELAGPAEAGGCGSNGPFGS